jgi:hypothetical protein
MVEHGKGVEEDLVRMDREEVGVDDAMCIQRPKDHVQQWALFSVLSRRFL